MPRLLGSVGRGAQNRPDDAKAVQQLLNRFRPHGAQLLRVDGLVGLRTITAIEDFQRGVLKQQKPDGAVLPNSTTFTALCGADPSKERIAWGAKVALVFKSRVLSLCAKLDMPADFLMSAMAFESGETFSSSIKNAAGSGAVGLIQFMPSTAKALGTTVEALASLKPEKQLDYVELYFRSRGGQLQSLEDIYMAVLYPAAIGDAPEQTLFKRGGSFYSQNRGLDANKDGKITVGEATSRVRAKFEKGIRPGFLG